MIKKISVSLGLLFLAACIDMLLRRPGISLTWITIFLLLAYHSPSGLRILMEPQFWVVIVGAIAPWVLFTGILLIGFEIYEHSGGSGEGVIVALAPFMAGGVALVIGILTALFRPLPNGLAAAFLTGLKLNNPIYLLDIWFGKSRY